MISLFNSQMKHQQLKSSAASTPPPTENGQTSSFPKKARQTKQRSVERQLTSSSILSHIVTHNLSKQFSNNDDSNDTSNASINNKSISGHKSTSQINKQFSTSTQNLNNKAMSTSSSSSSNKTYQFAFLKPTQSTSNKAFRSNKLNSSATLYEPASSGKKLNHRSLHHNQSGSPPPLQQCQDPMSSSGSSNNSDINELNENQMEILGSNLGDSNQVQNYHLPLSSNSLTSSSSSSCSLYENKATGNSSNNEKLNGKTEMMDDSNHTIKFDDNNKTTGLKTNFSKLNLESRLGLGVSKQTGDLDSNNGSSVIKQIGSTNFNCLKKPITFASIAAATSNNLINTINVQSSANNNNNICSQPTQIISMNSKVLTNEKN